MKEQLEISVFEKDRLHPENKIKAVRWVWLMANVRVLGGLIKRRSTYCLLIEDKNGEDK